MNKDEAVKIIKAYAKKYPKSTVAISLAKILTLPASIIIRIAQSIVLLDQDPSAEMIVNINLIDNYYLDIRYKLGEEE